MKKLAEFNDTEKKILTNFVTGGIGVGTGAALVAELVRHVRSEMRPITDDMISERRIIDLHDEKEESKVASDATSSTRARISPPAPPTPRANTPPPAPVVKKEDGPPGSIALGLGMLGGVGAVGGSYWLVRKLVTEMHRRRAAQELEEEQQKFNKVLAGQAAFNDGVKLASDGERRGMHNTEVVAALPTSLLATLLLASGGLTYNLLADRGGKPGPDKLTDNAKGAKLVIRRDLNRDGDADLEETVGYQDAEKTAGVRALALDLVGLMPESETALLIRQIKSPNDYAKFAADVSVNGWGPAMDRWATPSSEETPRRNISTRDILSATLLAGEPITKQAFALTVAAETAFVHPQALAAAGELDASTRNNLCKLAAHISVDEIVERLNLGEQETAPVDSPTARAGVPNLPPVELLRQLMAEGGDEVVEEQQGGDLAETAPSVEDVRRGDLK